MVVDSKVCRVAAEPSRAGVVVLRAALKAEAVRGPIARSSHDLTADSGKSYRKACTAYVVYRPHFPIAGPKAGGYRQVEWSSARRPA